MMSTQLVTSLLVPEYRLHRWSCDETRDQSSWSALARGSSLGKKSVLLYNALRATRQDSPVSILRAQGSDLDAQELTITLCPPLVVPLAFSPLLIGSLQNVTGELGNGEVAARGNFPGSAEPLSWPPLDAIIEWGIGGASARAVVDLSNGATVGIVASFVTVRASVSPLPDHNRGTSAAYVVSAFIGPGRPRQGRAQRTIYLGQIEPKEESVIVPVPAFAQAATVIASNDDASGVLLPSATLRLWQSTSRQKNVGNFRVEPGSTSAIELPNAAAYASVRAGRGCAARFSIIFALAL